MNLTEKTLTYLKNFKLSFEKEICKYEIVSITNPSANIFQINFLNTISNVSVGHYVFVSLGANEGFHEITAIGSNYIQFIDGSIQGQLGQAIIYSVSLSDLLFSLDFAKSYVKNITGLGFTGTEEITEYHDGTDTEELYLNRRPINSVTSVIFLSIPNTLYTIPISTIEIIPNQGILRIKNTGLQTSPLPLRCFPFGRNNIKVIYNAGFADYPTDVATAISMIATANLLDKEASLCGGATSLSVVSYSISFDGTKWKQYKKTLMLSAFSLLRPYKTGIVGS